MKNKATRQPTEARQTEIILTLLHLAARRGALEISTTDIANAMNVSQGALFRHFPNKEAIRLAVVAWIDTRLAHRQELARLAAGSPQEALRAMFFAHVDFFTEYPGAPRLVFGELQHPDHTPIKTRVCELMQHYRARLESVLAQVIGKRTEPAPDCAVASSLFLGAIQGLVIQAMITGNPAQMRQQADAVFELYLNALDVRT